MTWKEVEQRFNQTKTVLIPFGSTEEHGHHLPLSTDCKISYEVAKLVSEKTSALVTPPVCYGVCRRGSTFPGTITISFETMKSLATDIMESLYSQGMRNAILLPGHLGSAQLVSLELSAQELLRRYQDIKLAIVRLPEILKKLPAGIVDEPFGHAGEVETSIMMALFPEDVRMHEMGREIPVFPSHLVLRDSRSVMKTGIIGDATKASRRKGEMILHLLVDEIANLIYQLEGHIPSKNTRGVSSDEAHKLQDETIDS
ncbi:MAG: creatininase family protein [Candidatus Bathyarchaeia archaeon]